MEGHIKVFSPLIDRITAIGTPSCSTVFGQYARVSRRPARAQLRAVEQRCINDRRTHRAYQFCDIVNCSQILTDITMSVANGYARKTVFHHSLPEISGSASDGKPRSFLLCFGW